MKPQENLKMKTASNHLTFSVLQKSKLKRPYGTIYIKLLQLKREGGFSNCQKKKLETQNGSFICFETLKPKHVIKNE